MKTFKILGLLLSYPDPEWVTHLRECERVLAQEGILPKRPLSAVLAFIAQLKTADIYDAQEQYVATFDRGRTNCLHLFEHIHGDSRDRGQAMVNLAEAYAEKGLYIDRAELPDYIPLFLEFLSLCPADEAVALLGEPIDVIAAIGARLEKRNSPYAALFDSLVALARVKPDPSWISKIMAESPEDRSLEALDREWEESAAFDGQPAKSSCDGCTARPSNGLNVTINQ
jgi:nitrate reductase delta subunit